MSKKHILTYLVGHVRVVCGDWHGGLEAARRAVFPMSRRQGCFPHLIGATTRPALWEDEGGNVQHMYRSGIFARLREALVDQEHLALLKQYIYVTRHCPKGLFAGLWANMVAYLENHGERRAVQLLNGRYLFRSLA